MGEHIYQRVIVQTEGDSSNYHVGFSKSRDSSDPIRNGKYVLESCFHGLNKEELFDYVKHHRNIIKVGDITDEEELEERNLVLKRIKIILGTPSRIPLEKIINIYEIDPAVKA